MAIFGNFKGTTQSDFKIGKRGPTLFTSPRDGSSYTLAGQLEGDFWVDPGNSTIKIYTSELVGGSPVVDWRSIGSYLSDLNVDNGTLFVDSSNDTVSIGSTSSNEKLFVNGSLRLGTNPSIKYSGAYLDVKHANGTGTVLRLRDNTGNTNPVFKIYDANNSTEVFRVEGANTTVQNLVLSTASEIYTKVQYDPANVAMGLPGQVLSVDANSHVSWSTNYYYGNGVDSGSFATLGPLDTTKLKYGDFFYYLDPGEVGSGRLFVWITENGTDGFFLDFLPPNFEAV